MGKTVMACLDGSERSLAAVAEGIALLPPDTTFVVATVIGVPDPSIVTGTGMAGGTMSAEEFDRTETERFADAQTIVDGGARALGLTDARTEVLLGDPAGAICDFAAKENVAAVVMGSRGHGGFKRAVLGSVSDHVVRRAPCPVVVTGQHHE